MPAGERFEQLRATVREHRLATVCEESICPNIGECWNNGTATIMLMGKVCTRACQFCAVDTGNPRGWLDPEEVENSARTVELMGLKLRRADVRRSRRPAGRRRAALRRLHPRDQGALSANGRRGADAGLRRQARRRRDRRRFGRATYSRRISRPSSGSRTECATRARATRRRWRCSTFAKRHRADVLTKSSLMLGLGETEDEIAAALDDLKRAGVDIVTFGQYLRPTPNHLPVERYVTPQEFDLYRQWGSSAASSRSSRARSCARATAPTACSRRTTWGSSARVSEFLAAYGLFLAQLATLRPVGHRCRRAHRGVAPPRPCRGPRRRASEPPLRGRRRRAQARDRGQRALQEGRQGAPQGAQARGQGAREGRERRTPRLFVLDFKGDLRASAAASLREEVSAMLRVAKPGEQVLLRLENSGRHGARARLRGVAAHAPEAARLEACSWPSTRWPRAAAISWRASPTG